MNIVFLSARYPPDFIGGGELSTAAIARGLAGRGHGVTVLTGAPADGRESVHGVTVVRSRALHALWAKPLLEKRLSASMVSPLANLLPPQSDVLHAHDFRSALLLSLVPGAHRAVTVRDFASICGTTNNMWWDGTSCDGCFWPNVLFRCHRVVEASPARKPFRVWQYKYNLSFRGEAFGAIPHHVYTTAALRDRVATRTRVPPSARIIPNPVDDEWMSGPVADATPPRALFAGTVQSYKGVGVLLDAFAEAARELADVGLDIVGDGDLRAYEEKARRLDIASSVRFLGKLPPKEVRERMRAARVVVQPSLWEEPFGRTIIEAHALGRPVIASDTGGLHELVPPETGILVPPGNAFALARALRRCFTDEHYANALGRAGRNRVERAFTANRIAEKYEAFYMEVVRPRS